MNRCLIPFLFILNLNAYSQLSSSISKLKKPPIDSCAIAGWADLLWCEPIISNDGKYFMYEIENRPAGGKTLVIQSTSDSWKNEFIGADKGFFSGDSKQAIFKLKDSLYFLSFTGSRAVTVISGVSSYMIPPNGDNRLLAYQLDSSDGRLVLLNLDTGKKITYSNVSEYLFDNKGRELLVKCTEQVKENKIETIKIVDVANNKNTVIWEQNINKELVSGNFLFDESGDQLVFFVHNKSGDPLSRSIWYYNSLIGKAIEKVNIHTGGIDLGMILGNSGLYFSKNGKHIFFKIKPLPKPPVKPNDNAVMVDVWSYKDLVKQNIQLYNITQNANQYTLTEDKTMFIAANSNRVGLLDSLNLVSEVYGNAGDNIVIGYKKYNGDKVWLRDSANYFLLSLNTGVKSPIGGGMLNSFSFSKDGKYVVYFDYERGHFYSYNVILGKSINISDKIPEKVNRNSPDKGITYKTNAVGIKGWLDKYSVIIYDNWDIWKVDITGDRPPINLTNGYGKSANIVFRLLEEHNLDEGYLYSGGRLLLTAFNSQNKNNGFYICSSGKAANPVELSMHPAFFSTKQDQTNLGLITMDPVKAARKKMWIVKRQRANEAPNFYITKDFQTFRLLTNIQPQKDFNWMTSELLTWMQFDGQVCQGILYKPENFDSSKRYPVIINYYEKKSDQLHQFLQPGLISGDLNIPWFVSRGYLVFIPDINYTIGKTGQSVVNSVISGARYLFQFPFVDSARVGIHGHSFGGYETNYLITQSNIFAAAAEGAGLTDFISKYGSLLPDGSVANGYNMMHFDKAGQLRLEATIWDDSSVYISNSPIFYADKVSTPLLMMHNKNDQAVQWSQAVEFFIALRRLDKKVWMLQYDQGGHGVDLLKDQIDYTTRMTQFFDHYLKHEPPPIWMTRSIPAKTKGIESGLSLDPAGSCGRDCQICISTRKEPLPK